MTASGVAETQFPPELLATVAEAASALMGGDVDRYFSLVRHTGDYSLMAPYGGETRRGIDLSEERLSEMRSFFRSGQADLEVVHAFASGDLAVLVAIERQAGDVGGLQQDWSLRVTQVFRREDGEWRLAHRHADALVHPITFDRFAELAQG
jgi:ketosteroid isomerase-like protein